MRDRLCRRPHGTAARECLDCPGRRPCVLADAEEHEAVACSPEDLAYLVRDMSEEDQPNADATELETAYEDLADRLGPRVLVQEMVPAGVEMLLGISRDPQFGPLLTMGMGGIFVELLADVRMLWLPATEASVRRALSELRAADLLKGVRGRPPANVDSIVQAALALSTLVDELGDEIAEIDINPLVALPHRAVAVDALIVPTPPAH